MEVFILKGLRARKNRVNRSFYVSVDSKKFRCERGRKATPLRMIQTSRPIGTCVPAISLRCPYELMLEIGQIRAYLKRALAHPPEDDESQRIKGSKTESGADLPVKECTRILLEVKSGPPQKAG